MSKKKMKSRRAKKKVKRSPSSYERAVAFFAKHAGWGYHPGKESKTAGKMRGARRLAKAEAEAANRGWRVKWDYEQDVDLSWMDDEEREKDHEVLWAALRNEDGEMLASLGNIVDADNKYRRVVEAELAVEALGDEIE